MTWKSIADLFTDRAAPVALLGAPMEAGSVTPGRCDLAPETVRRTLRRFSTYDLETGEEIQTGVRDLGDVTFEASPRPTALARSSRRFAARSRTMS